MRRCLPSISQKLQRRELNGRLAPIPANLEERAAPSKAGAENPSRELLWPSGGAMQLENPQLLLQPGFSTRFFHVEFTKGVYCRRIDYGQCGIEMQQDQKRMMPSPSRRA